MEVIYNTFTYSEQYENHQHIFTISELDIFGIMYAFGVQAVNLSICFFLLFLFIMKLMDVTVDMGPEFGVDIDPRLSQGKNHRNTSSIPLNGLSESNMVNIRLNDKQRYLLDIMTKYFVLSFFAIISTQIATMFFSASWIAATYDEDTGIALFHIFHILFPIDCIITSCCLFFNFGSTNAYYKKNKICRKCHYCSLLCFKQITKDFVNRRYTEYSTLPKTLSLTCMVILSLNHFITIINIA